MPEVLEGTADRIKLAVLDQRVTNVEVDMRDLRQMVGGMNGKLTTILVSIATAAILLAINLVIGGIAP